MRALWVLLILISACVRGDEPPTPESRPKTASFRDLLIDPADLRTRPVSGMAWRKLLAVASEGIDSPDLSDQDDRDNVRALAKALVFARTGEAAYRQEVVEACEGMIGTAKGRTLALGRELAAYVIAADLVGLPKELDHRFRRYLQEVRQLRLSGRTLVSTHEDRPNNWGTHAGASRIAVALYLGDEEDLRRSARVFKGWLGDQEAYSSFSFGDLAWQANPKEPLGINPAGTTLQGYSVDGVLPDDQRRGGVFQWPPPKENYVYEALQGALLQAILLHRAGYDDVWEWSDSALLRAFEWLHEVAGYPAEGDDRWQVWVVNHFYERSFPTSGTTPGKGFGFADWLYPKKQEPEKH